MPRGALAPNHARRDDCVWFGAGVVVVSCIEPNPEVGPECHRVEMGGRWSIHDRVTAFPAQKCPIAESQSRRSH